MKFVAEDYGELLTLHRALMEAKFALDPENPNIAASPLLITLMERLIEAIAAHQSARGANSDWGPWRTSPNPEYVRRIQAAASRERSWPRLNDGEKALLLMQLAAPFVLSNDLLEEIRQSVDAALTRQ